MAGSSCLKADENLRYEGLIGFVVGIVVAVDILVLVADFGS